MVWDIFYPEKCMLCGKLLGEGHKGVCPVCRKVMPYITGDRCIKCSKKTYGSDDLCMDCKKHAHLYRQGYALFAYDANMERIIAGIKYSGRWNNIGWLAKELAYHASIYIRKWEIQLVVPVPIHKSKLRKRGFNQAALVACAVAAEYGIPYDDRLILRSRNTRPQKNLDVNERKNNLKNSFIIDKRRYSSYKELKSIMLVDDIYTSGSTVDECAGQLMEAGAGGVYFLALCVGNGYS